MTLAGLASMVSLGSGCATSEGGSIPESEQLHWTGIGWRALQTNPKLSPGERLGVGLVAGAYEFGAENASRKEAAIAGAREYHRLDSNSRSSNSTVQQKEDFDKDYLAFSGRVNGERDIYGDIIQYDEDFIEIYTTKNGQIKIPTSKIIMVSDLIPLGIKQSSFKGFNEGTYIVDTTIDN